MLRRRLTSFLKRTVSGWNIVHYQWLLVAVSTLIAARVNWIQHGWVNDDSLLYFEVARLLAANDWQAAFALYSWLFYPALLAAGHLITGCKIHCIAQMLNIVFFSLFSLGFAKLLIAAGGRVKTLCWGFALLLSTPYIVGDILGMLLRDQGFWAAFVWGLYFLLNYMQHGKCQSVLLFQLAMGIATLFRVEAIVYLLILPVLSLITGNQHSLKQRIWHSLAAISLSLMGGMILTLAVLSGLLQPKQLGRLHEIIELLHHGLSDHVTFIATKADIIGKQVLGHHLDEYAVFSLLSSLLLIVAFKTIKVAGWPVLFLLIAGRKGWSRMHTQAQVLFRMQLMLGFITSALIIVKVFVLSSRYLIASGIVMLVIAAFTTETFYQHAGVWLKRTLLAILALMLLANLYDKPHVDLDRQAVEYIQSINQNHAPVMYDTENARFYAGQPFQKRIPSIEYVQAKLEHQDISHYTYLMITIKHNNQDYEKRIAEKLAGQFSPIKTLYGWRKKDKVVIYIKEHAS